MENIGAITTLEELHVAKANFGVVLYHAHTCKYCRDFLPIYKELAKKEPQMFYEAEASKARDVLAEDKIMSYPTLIYWYQEKRHQFPLNSERTEDVVRTWLRSIDSGRVKEEEVRAPGKSCSAKSGQCSNGGRHANQPISRSKISKSGAPPRRPTSFYVRK